MAENNEIYKLADITNETDVKVVFDNKLPEVKIARAYNEQYNSNNEDKKFTQNDDKEIAKPITDTTDELKVNGIKIPLIKINNLVVMNNDLVYFKLNYKEFKPSVSITIKKNNYIVLNTPGLVNIITVVMMPPVDGTYKKISLNFYITNVQEADMTVKYSGEYLLPNLEIKYNRILSYNDNTRLSTYYMLESIAKECKLGFASTKMCQNVNDTKIRLMRNQNFSELIKEHIKFGGINENSIFDTWIDVYNNLVLCNVSWVINKAVQSNELSIKNIKGINFHDTADIKNNPNEFTEDMFRTLTNFKHNSEMLNNKILKYNWIVDNSSVKSHGTNNKYYILDHINNGGNNFIDYKSILIEDNSNDGKNFKQIYNFEKNKFIGVEMGNSIDGNTPVLYQEKSRKAFFTKLNYKILKVELSEINFGLERGNLVNILIFEYNRENKILMMNQINSLRENGNDDIYPEYDEENKELVINNNEFGIPNLSISGIYYIEGIEYVYKQNNQNISEILYLSRKNDLNNYYNFSSTVKIPK